jgi:hypothetical protein
MPEIKNMFLNGKMNKDLDERLIPKGEYRDALNIDVAYSEGADVGVLQNILSNEEVPGINLVGGTCVGVVKDTEHDKIYWLITSATKDAIAEYDGTTVSPIIVDTHNNILKFDAARYITGINILDGILYYTDNFTEPKQIDIDYWKSQTTNFSNNTTNLSEDRITIIKKSPLNAPTFDTLSASVRGGVGTLGNATEIISTSIPNLATTNTGVSITIVFSTAPNYLANDIIILEKNIIVGQSTESSSARVKITSVTNTTTFVCTLLAKTDNIKSETNVSYIPVLEEEEPLFELKFPRFSYRYKYKNGQYSTFAPFSLPAFLAGDFEYNAKKAYNLGMENQIRVLKLKGWGSEENIGTISNDELTPSINNYAADIEEIDVLYKDSVSANIYIVDTIKKENGKFATIFEIKDEQIFKTIASNQLLRTFDSVPKKALGQEIVGNRLIYSNITENFNYNSKPNFTLNTVERNDTTEIAQKLSLKTLRTYQLGISFKDKYGRETPVFSDKTGVLKLPRDNAEFNLQFEASTSTTAPTEATHYKYYIKETSNEYYNVCISNIYDDEEGFLYLSLPSAEINKISEDDFLILKKESGNVAYKSAEKKFKVIDKLNNPPNFLAKKEAVSYSANIFTFDREFAEDSTMDRKVPGITPVEGHNTIFIQDAGASGDGTENVRISDQFRSQITIGTKVRFRRSGTGTNSNIYTVKSFQNTKNPTSNNGGAELTFEEAFGSDVNVLYGTNQPAAAISRNEIILEKISIEDDLGNPEYEGKFFIKLNNSVQLKEALTEAFDETLLNTISTKPVFTTGIFEGADRGYWISHFAGVGSVMTSKTSNGVTIPAGFHLALRTLEDYLDSDSFYSSDPFNKAFVEGNYIRISGGNQRRNDGTDDFTAMYENSTTANGAVSNSKTLVVANATGIEIGDNITASGGFTQTEFVKVEAINGTTITMSSPQTINNGTTIRFMRAIENHPNYKILEVIQTGTGSGQKGEWFLKFDKNFDVALPDNNEQYVNIESRTFNISTAEKPVNPPIFEVEPKEGVLEIYYETQKTHPIADLNSIKRIPWTNCISFGNGVESDRIRDDYNAPRITNGVRVSAVIEESYQEDHLKSRLIFSGIYNSKTNLNRLNEFIIAEPITKDLNPEYGSIQKLHARDTDLIALCEDRVVKILANKDALFNADGNPQLTATNRVLGQAIIPATFGAYGISKNPESFVDFTYRAYFTDKSRGKVLRLSMDGLTEISEYGMKDYFKDNLAAETGLILGTYDTNKGLYNLTFENEADTVSFSEGVRGWTSRKSFIPEAGVSLNNMYYTFKNGKLYKHYNSSDNRNTFYGTTTNSEVTLILNDSPANIKNFRTLNYKGDSGWVASSILTEKQDGAISSFINKEDIYYNYISGVTEGANTLDTKAFNIQGLGGLTSTSISSGTRSFVFNFNLPDGISVPDNLYYVNSNDDKINLGTITNVDKENKTIDIGSYDTNIIAPSASDYMFYVKDAKFNTSGILGYYAEITMTNTSTAKKELYSVGSEISLSS